MEQIAIFFKFLNLYSHNSHFRVGRSSFFSDHEYLGELYDTYESAYDAVIERMIGLGQNPDNFAIVNAANAKFQQFKDEVVTKNATYFVNILSFEKQLVALLESVAPNVSLGTNNIIASWADESEQRQYKLGQRVDAEIK